MYNKTVLDSGLRIITEEMPEVKSVTVGLWVGCGSRDEEEELSGICHFLEHMLFKGTSRRSAREIAVEVDSLGGIINAYTGKENTVFYLKVPHYHLPKAVELLADMVCDSVLATEEIEKEKAVVAEEIALGEDTPEDHIHDLFDLSLWVRHPLGRSVLGTRESVSSFNQDKLFSFLKKAYGAGNIVVAAAGNVKHGAFVSLVTSFFSALSSSFFPKNETRPAPVPGMHLSFRPLEQVHLIVGALAPGARTEERYAVLLANGILGSSMSSRLFQEIREKRGLAYGVHSFWVPYRDLGIFGIYCACSPSKVREVLLVIREELTRFRETPVAEEELMKVKELIKGNYFLSLESTDNRMTRLAKSEINFGRFIDTDEFTEKIYEVTVCEIQRTAQRVFHPSGLHLTVLGEIKKTPLENIWLKIKE